MITKTENPSKINLILDNLDIKVKLKEIYDDAKYPKCFSSRRFKELFSQYIKGGLTNYNYTANCLFEKKRQGFFL